MTGQIRTVSRFEQSALLLCVPFLKWLNRRYSFGAFRFWLTRIIYKLPCYPETRRKRIDFILKYLPELKQVYWVGLPVLDIGCTDSLLLYEIAERRYSAHGLDMRDYQAELPKNIEFFKNDITDPDLVKKVGKTFYAVIATSTIELVQASMYDEERKIEGFGDRKAIENIHKLMNDDGFFILSVPTTYWRNINARGYSFLNFLALIQGLFIIIEVEHIGGHICAVLAKIEMKED